MYDRRQPGPELKIGRRAWELAVLHGGRGETGQSTRMRFARKQDARVVKQIIIHWWVSGCSVYKCFEHRKVNSRGRSFCHSFPFSVSACIIVGRPQPGSSGNSGKGSIAPTKFFF